MKYAIVLGLCLGVCPSTTFAQQRDRGDRTFFGYPPSMPHAASEVYKTVGGEPLKLYIFTPEGQQPRDKRPAIVFFFGGGFTHGTPSHFQPQCEYFASRGMVAITADYRVRNRQNTGVAEAILDGRDAMRWVRANAERLGIDPHKIVASGGSAGGLIAACVSIVPTLDQDARDDLPSYRADAMVLFNPAWMGPSPPARRSDGAKRELDANLLPVTHVRKGLPPCLMLFGTADRLLDGARQFQQAAERLGNRCELKTWDGVGHGFYNPGRAANTGFVEAVIEADKFLASLGYLSGPPTISRTDEGFVLFDGSPVHSRKSLVMKYGEKTLTEHDKNQNGKLDVEEFLALREDVRRGLIDVPENVVADIDVEYGRAGDTPLLLDIYRAKDRSNEPVPAIVWIHGGGWRSGSKLMGRGRLMEFVPSGRYVGVSVEYRLTDQAPWPAQIQDCKAAIRWIRAHAAKYGIDPNRIGIAGHSAGAHLVDLLGTSGDEQALEGDGGTPGVPSRVSCVVSFAGPSDFVTMVEHHAKRRRPRGGAPFEHLFGGPPDEKHDELKAASPVTYITPDDPPFLIVHGTDDPIVPFDSQAAPLDQALRKAGVTSALITVQGGQHVFRGLEGPVVDRRVLACFDKHLYGRKVDVASQTILAQRQ